MKTIIKELFHEIIILAGVVLGVIVIGVFIFLIILSSFFGMKDTLSMARKNIFDKNRKTAQLRVVETEGGVFVADDERILRKISVYDEDDK